ncbi:hypothetical protein B0J17DRAFT_579001 [Rhizoctonia solani]|nr:hypothetical protein B0J17DRAFT_579001 [Rhizoctonia solani]
MSAGTTALLYSARDCNKECRVTTALSQTGLSKPYSPAFHCALLALWGASSHCSFDSLMDRSHQAEVEYLYPGTKLPSSVTLSCDIKLIHAQYVPKIREYFQVCLFTSCYSNFIIINYWVF